MTLDSSKRFARAHSAWLEPPETKAPEPVAQCEWTHHDLYEGDVYYRTAAGDTVCCECWPEFAADKLGADRRVA